MARTSECGEGESGSGGSSNSREGNQVPVAPIKQEALINLDPSSDVSLSAEEKDWLFVPASSSSSNGSNNNELVNHTVLFGSNVTDTAGKEKMERVLDNANRFVDASTTFMWPSHFSLNTFLCSIQRGVEEGGFQLTSRGTRDVNVESSTRCINSSCVQIRLKNCQTWSGFFCTSDCL